MNEMRTSNFCKTFGVLDFLAVSDNKLSVAGWVVSLENDPIQELRICVGDLAVGLSRDHLLPSPDVGAAWPMLRMSGNCRFVINMELSGDHLQRVAQRDIISITPYIRNMPGIPMERIWPPIFGTPSSEESDFVGRGEFTETSFSFLSLFRLVAGLRRDESILDAGCGLGRMAFALGHYLNDQGSYNGFDVSKRFVDMAKTRFRLLGNFKFQHVDIYNKMYNANGRIHAADFLFPFANSTFSFVFLTSVFTHMLAADVNNYLREIRRVLHKDGRCFATFFIIDEDAKRLIETGRSTISLSHTLSDGCVVANSDVPENAVGYREEELRAMVEEAGMRIVQSYQGQWPGRTSFLTYQDVFLLVPA